MLILFFFYKFLNSNLKPIRPQTKVWISWSWSMSPQFWNVSRYNLFETIAYEDEIKDGFYDIGQNNSDKVPLSILKPLEDYLCEDVNNRLRAVYIVNPKPPK